MFNKDFIIDGRRLSASAITITFWVAVLFLGTGFTSLITPNSILTWEPISGTELDFNSEVFWEWVRSTLVNDKLNTDTTSTITKTLKGNLTEHLWVAHGGHTRTPKARRPSQLVPTVTTRLIF